MQKLNGNVVHPWVLVICEDSGTNHLWIAGDGCSYILKYIIDNNGQSRDQVCPSL